MNMPLMHRGMYSESRFFLECVSHSIVLEKLAARGLDGCTLDWVKTGWMAGPKELS